MTAVSRYAKVTGGVALLTVASADAGDDLATIQVEREFAAADVGAGAGQTRDATDPTVGCLVAQFTGSRIIRVEIVGLYRALAATNRTFSGQQVIGSAANTVNLATRVSYNAQTGVSSIYVLDSAAAAPGRIVAADYLILNVLLGSSATITPLG